MASAPTARTRRINKEILDCNNDKTSNIEITMVDDSPFHLVGTFPGPENSPYEGACSTWTSRCRNSTRSSRSS